MTTAGVLTRLGVKRSEYPGLYKMPLDWAIGRLRRIREENREWSRSFDATGNEIDAAYDAWRSGL